MAVEVYRMYMHERLLTQLDWGACQVYFETLLEEDFSRGLCLMHVVWVTVCVVPSCLGLRRLNSTPLHGEGPSCMPTILQAYYC